MTEYKQGGNKTSIMRKLGRNTQFDRKTPTTVHGYTDELQWFEVVNSAIKL